MRDSRKLGEVGLHVRSECNEGSFVSHVVAVIGCAENSDEPPVVLYLVTLVFHLVASYHELQIIPLQERLCDVWSKLDGNTSLAWSSAERGLRITPKHLAHVALVRWLPVAVELLQVCNRDVVGREEASVNNKSLLVDNVTQRKPAEHLAEDVRHLASVLCLYFALEPVNLVHALALVVASRKVKRVWIQALESEESENDLSTPGASIDKVSIEEVRIGLARHVIQLKNVQKIEELAVDVTAHGELAPFRDVNVHHIGQALEQRQSPENDHGGVTLVNLLPRLEVFDHRENEIQSDHLLPFLVYIHAAARITVLYDDVFYNYLGVLRYYLLLWGCQSL
mmetsp:Transcript_11238/g.21117  ORF Transcript_11238/g.21117 Transcript_11238/m.21117 type:complete len:338 (+) Transcript_11238:982-1995(+)